MPIVENHCEHAFQIPPQSAPITGKDKDGKDVKDGPLMATPIAYQDAVTFPRAGKVNDDGNPEPSRTKVSADVIARMKASPIMRSWFKPAGGKVQLAIASDTDAGESTPMPNEDALGAPKKAQPRA